MRYRFNANQRLEMDEFQQRTIDASIQSISERQAAIRQAKHGYIGMLAGILVGGIVSWLFFGPNENTSKEKTIPVIRRPLIAAKVQPNDPGGMEIDNQDREIYHIVDNIPQKKEEVKIIPAPEVPQIVVENTITAPENIDKLVETIEDDSSLEHAEIVIEPKQQEETKVASQALAPIKTNSNEKIMIPEKIKDIGIKLQNTINSETKAAPTNMTAEQPKKALEKAPQVASPATKGTWYAQLIASSSRKAVESLWNQLSAKYAFLQTYSHEIEEITAANGSTLYRLKVGAFKTRKEAETLSNKLKQNQISSIIKQN